MNKRLQPGLNAQATGVVLLRLAILFLAATCLVASILFFAFSYQFLTETLFSRYGQPEKLLKFRTTLLTPERFAALRYLSLLLTFLCIGSIFFLWKQIPALVQQFYRIASSIRLSCVQTYMKTSVAERVLLGGLLLLVSLSRLYFFAKLPLHVDERFTYLYFVSKGWLVSAAYYPNPNNHILFSLLCNGSRLFTDSPLLVLRIPAYVAGLAAMVGFWLVARYYFAASVAGLATALLAFAPPVFGYGIQGRGYSLLLCWVVLAAAATVKIVSAERIKPTSAFLFGLSSLLGFYTIPIFLYPFAGMTAYLAFAFLQKRLWAQMARIGLLVLGIGLGVWVLYLPVFLANGWNAVTGNSWVAPIAWPAFIATIGPNLAECSYFLWNDLPLSPYLTVCISGLAAMAALSKSTTQSERHWSGLFLSCLWVVVPIVFLQRTLLYSRVLIFILPLQGLVISMLLRRFLTLKRYYFPVLLILGGLAAGHCLYTFGQLVTERGKGIYTSLDGVSGWLFRHRADNIYVQYYEYGLCIRFQYETNHRPIGLDVGADRFSSEKKYTFVVVHNDHRFPAALPTAAYRKVYQDAEAVIYARKTDNP